MAIESIPTFGGNDDENTSGSEAETTTSTLELTGDELATYTQYEAFVDMGRYVAKLREHDESDDLAALFEWIAENKESLRKECKELPGNLPMFRSAFPVEDRCGDDYYVLPSEEAAKVGVDYEDEDHILLPISDGKKWTPSVSLGRPTYVDENFGESDDESSESSEAASSLDVSSLTVADIRATITNVEDVENLEAMLEDEKSGEARKTAIEAIEMRLRAVSEADDESDEAAEAGDDESESADDEVAAAKVEALNAATEAISELTDAIQNL